MQCYCRAATVSSVSAANAKRFSAGLESRHPANGPLFVILRPVCTGLQWPTGCRATFIRGNEVSGPDSDSNIHADGAGHRREFLDSRVSYIGEQPYGAFGYDGSEHFLNQGYSLSLLLEYAATLGLI